MILKRLCFVAALAATISMLTACGGSGDSGFPVTPGVPDSGVPDAGGENGPDMPETPESATPGGSSEPQPSDTPIVIAPNNPLGMSPSSEPSSAPTAPLPTASPAPSAHFVPHTAAAFTAVPAFAVRSATFKNDKTVPLSMVYKGNGCHGGDISPQLQWTGAPKKTKSFAVLMLDTTAIFWHWGMYDIAKTATSLPQNAGTSSSKYGKNVLNDWSIHFGKKNRGYGGTCPPKGTEHRYVITLYALDTTLNLPASAHVQDLDLAIRRHILGSASITGR